MTGTLSEDGLKMRVTNWLRRRKEQILSWRKFFTWQYWVNLYIQLRSELGTFSLLQLLVVIFVFALFMILPLISVIWTAFVINGQFSLLWFQLIFSDARFWPVGGISGVPIELVGDYLYIRGIDAGAILNTIYVGLATTVISTLIGVALAFFMARYEFRGKSILRVLLLIPILSTPFVSAVSIKKIFGEFGMLNLIFYPLTHVRLIIEGLAAVILVQSLHFFSLVYLSTYAAFLAIDPSLEEQGENMGAKGFGLFRRVTLPLALPGIEAGAILTFILSVEDLGTLVVFSQDPQVRRTITYQIFSLIFAPTGTINPIAPALSVLLLFIAIISFLLIRRYMSLRQYAMQTKGGTWNPRLHKAKWYQAIAIYIFIGVVLFFALLTPLGIILLAFSTEWGTTILPVNFPTIINFFLVFTDYLVVNSIVNSLLYSAVAVLIIIGLATGIAYIVARKKLPGLGVIDLLVTIPIALPGIVIAMGYFLFFVRIPLFTNTLLNPLITTIFLFFMALAVRKFPFTVRSTFAGLQQTNVELEEAAENLGASRARTFVGIVIPLVAVSVLAGGMMSFVYCMSEVSVSLVLGGVKPEQAPLTWKMMDVLSQVAAGSHSAAVLGFLLMIIQITIITIVNVVLKHRTEAMVGL
ncbi:MAG: ABC transporter permease [Candidatus Hodarchaeota archaeon]